MKARKQLSNKLKQRFDEKQNELDRRPAVMGDGAGNLYVTGFDNFVYVTMGDKAVPVFNNRVPPQTGVHVWVGYAAEEPTLFQVLSTRSESPAGVQTGFVGYAPARRYEWMARNGGQDPLSVHLRAFTPLKLSVSPEGWMFVDLYRGFVYSSGAYIAVPRQNIDLYAQIPTTAGLAAFVLITINTSGTVVQTKGSEVNIEVLAITDIPAVPAGTAFVCGAVRVYYGQLEVQEGRTNTDFVDLRFPGYAGGGLWQPLDADLTSIAGLSPADDDVIQRKAGAWVNRTIAQIWADIIAYFAIVPGTWTPTGTTGTNVAVMTTYLMNYVRIGNQVMFNGVVAIETTAIGAFTCYLSLPIASDFTLSTDASGNGTNPTAASSIISIREDATNNRLQLDGYAQVNTNLFYRLVGGYVIK